jgi:hypothetical protein
MDLVEDAFALGPRYGVNEWWRHYWKILRALDWLHDLRLRRRIKAKQAEALNVPPSRILIAAVEVPGREGDLRRLMDRMCRGARHPVDTAIFPMAPVGKFQNIESAIRTTEIERYEWLLITDDDVEVPDNFLNDLIEYATRCELHIAQPAHRFLSFSTFKVTRRHWNSLVRRTNFVEIGPVTLLHRSVFASILPFPALRWAWGLDFHWAHLAWQRNWRLGVVDAVPLRHLRPIAESYSAGQAANDAKDFLRRTGFDLSKQYMLSPGVRIA